jgi:hypothetical protein
MLSKHNKFNPSSKIDQNRCDVTLQEFRIAVDGFIPYLMFTNITVHMSIGKLDYKTITLHLYKECMNILLVIDVKIARDYQVVH